MSQILISCLHPKKDHVTLDDMVAVENYIDVGNILTSLDSKQCFFFSFEQCCVVKSTWYNAMFFTVYECEPENIAQTNNIIFADRINIVLINVVHNRCLK